MQRIGRWTKLVIFLGMLALASLKAASQSSTLPGADPSSSERYLVDLGAAENQTGTYVLYRQSYLDAENRKVSYSGSIYGAIKSIKAEHCVVTLDAQVVDLFSGIVGKWSSGQQQDSTTYSISFPINRKVADSVEVIEARPAQLRRSTHSICPEKPSCTLHWLRIYGDRPEIQESIVTNDLLEFRGYVDHVAIPLSSTKAGDRLISELHALASTRCK